MKSWMPRGTPQTSGPMSGGSTTVTIEREDLPTMTDMCFGDDYCEECEEANEGGTCPCGLMVVALDD